jgi:hypothetical protein
VPFRPIIHYADAAVKEPRLSRLAVASVPVAIVTSSVVLGWVSALAPLNDLGKAVGASAVNVVRTVVVPVIGFYVCWLAHARLWRESGLTGLGWSRIALLLCVCLTVIPLTARGMVAFGRAARILPPAPIPLPDNDFNRFAIEEWGLQMPAAWRPVRGATAHDDFDSRWYLVELPPKDIDRFLDAVTCGLEKHPKLKWTIHHDDGPVSSVSLHRGAPRWWRPNSLTDKESVSLTGSIAGGGTHGYWIVFSRSSGTIFIYYWAT